MWLLSAFRFAVKCRLPGRDGGQGGERDGARDGGNLGKVDPRSVQRDDVLRVLHVNGLKVQIIRNCRGIHRSGQRQLRLVDKRQPFGIAAREKKPSRQRQSRSARPFSVTLTAWIRA